MSVEIIVGDCREKLAAMEAESVDSCVCDPPYHLASISKRWTNSARSESTMPQSGPHRRVSRGFMGQTWDGGDVAFDPETWAAVFRVLKPGAHLVAFSGTRTYHRMACAIEDAGFEIRDQLAWIYGSGFPKSHDVSKGIDKLLGAERVAVGPKMRPDGKTALSARRGDESRREGWDRPWRDDPEAVARNGMETAPATPEAAEWQGWGTALKPAWEPICLARKPLIGTVAANVLAHGTGAINIDGCRIEAGDSRSGSFGDGKRPWETGAVGGNTNTIKAGGLGRWPANIIHDGSEEVLAGFPETENGGQNATSGKREGMFGERQAGVAATTFAGDPGSAARFFYCAKTTSAERGEGNGHPTVKPQALMRWLCRLVTPKGGLVLDPFAGSGSTLIAADQEGFRAVGIELSEEYAAIARKRLADDRGPLFGAAA